MTTPSTTIDVCLSPGLIEQAKQRARGAVERTRNLEVEAADAAARTAALVESNHLTEHLAKLFGK